MPLFKSNAFVDDPWTRLDDGACVPADGSVIVTLEQFQALPSLRDRAAPLGVLIQPGTAFEHFAGDLPRFQLVALAFPKFGDGRAYSLAQQIRGRGYAGTLRATGDVLFDELQFMARCGFDEFEIVDPVTIKLLQEGRRDRVSSYYQPGLRDEAPAGTRPWTRKRQS